MPPDLCAPPTTVERLADWWLASRVAVPAADDVSAEIEVREDVLFTGDSWVSLGEIALQIPRIDPESAADAGTWNAKDYYLAAIRGGSYLWKIPDAEQLDAQLLKTIIGKTGKDEDRASAGRVRDAIGYVLLRLGLEMPLLDAHDLSELPFRKPVTLVADTNSILQGGVDFSVRFLYPMARLRVPEPVHSELSNQAASYFSARRKFKPDSDKTSVLRVLRERLTSQGGIRALLRVQLQNGVEIERLQAEAEQPRHFDLAGDPLGKPKDRGDRSAVPDRMILETALRHRSLIAPGHPVRIMTADQGLARSAMIEGLVPLYLPPRRWQALFGRSYLGAVFSPVQADSGTVWHRVSLTEVLWELAFCFGRARLRIKNHGTYTVIATDRELSWSPYHAREDLLWTVSETNGVPLREAVRDDESEPTSDAPPARTPNSISTPEPRQSPSLTRGIKATRLVVPKFNTYKLLAFWDWLAVRRGGTIKQAVTALGVSEKTAKEYFRLMASGEFITVDAAVVLNSETFDPLWMALRSSDWNAVRKHLLQLPSFAAFVQEVARGIRPPGKLTTIRGAALPGFQRLGELCGAILDIPGRGICFCDEAPKLDRFCERALEAYAAAVKIESSTAPLVLSGTWMEILAAEHRVHPLFVPSLLQESITARRLSVVFEGSIPFRGRGNHVFRRLGWRRDTPWLEDIPLYRGTYLSERASIHLRIESLL